MGIPLRLLVAVVGDVHLAADDRLDACSLGVFEELNGTCHRSVIGECDRRHLELRGARDEIWDPARTVEDRVLRVNVEVYER
jgi:hypothetical protein